MAEIDPFDTQSELHRKALDQVAHLLSGYEAGHISAEAFRVGVETIWNVLGGVCKAPGFNELMKDANREVRALPPSTLTKVLGTGDRLIVLMRTSEQVRVIAAAGARQSVTPVALIDQAIEKVTEVEGVARTKGYEEIAA